MSDEPRDPLLDPLLDELLTDRHPPDLKQPILDRLRDPLPAGGADCHEIGQEAEPFRLPVELHAEAEARSRIVDPPAIRPRPIGSRRVSRGSRRVSRGRRRAPWLQLAGLAVVLLVVVVGAIWNFRGSHGEREIAIQPEAPRDTLEKTPEANPPSPTVEVPTPPAAPTSSDSDRSSLLADAVDQSADDVVPATGVEPTGRSPVRIQREVAADEEIVEFINRRLAMAWAAAEVTPTSEVASVDWCRRAYQRIIGRLPSPEELKTFQNDRRRQSRARLISKLCESPEFAQHWAEYLATVLLGSGSPADPKVDRAELQRYLRQSLAAGKPYDALAVELLTAEGVSRPVEGRNDFSGATNFLLSVHSGDQSQVTDKVCRVFLGRQIKCAQCHVHPLNGWRQEQFWQFTAFFAQMRRVDGQEFAQLLDGNFHGELGRSPQEAEIFFELPDQTYRTAYPEFLDGTRISRSGLLDDVNRRRALAELIVGSDDFARAAVNRVWDRVLGSGFTLPVDDMGPHNPPSHPRVLERLAVEFRASGFDLRTLVRWVTLTNAFNRQSRPVDQQPPHDVELFASFNEEIAPRQPLLGTLKVLAADQRQNGSRIGVYATLSQLGKDKLLSPDQRRQKLRQINSNLEERLLDASTGGLLSRIASSQLDKRQQINHVFHVVLGRSPTASEAKEALTLLEAGTSAKVLRELVWALLNSPEFAVEH